LAVSADFIHKKLITKKMDEKTFYDYAVKCNENSQGYENKDIAEMRDFMLKSEYKDIVNVADMLEKEHFNMSFARCLNGKFYHYWYNWADIYVKNLKTYIFFCNSKAEAELIYQLWRKYNIIIIQRPANLEDIKDAIVAKINMLEERKRQVKELKEKRRANKKRKPFPKNFHKRPRIKASAYNKNYGKTEYNNFNNNKYGRQ